MSEAGPKDNVLFVDDESHILTAFKRQFRKQFVVHTALSGEEALEKLQGKHAFSVVVSDCRMPGMDGIQLLTKVREKYPDTVRLMLTGYADLETTIAAVNEGNIFRFATKPCPQETLTRMLNDAIEQYHLVIAERELLEQTLQGSIKVLTDMLSLANPVAFGRAKRIQKYVTEVAKTLALPKRWQFQLAGLLSQIGCITIPEQTLEKVFKRKSLTPEEWQMFSTHPETGRRLLLKIPRLETVADMIGNQQVSMERDLPGEDALFNDQGLLGGMILKVVIDFDAYLSQGFTIGKALQKLAEHDQKYSPRVLKALNQLSFESHTNRESESVHIRQLEKGRVLAQDVFSKEGVLLAAKDQEISEALRKRFLNLYNQGRIDETVNIIKDRANAEG
jgi:response regulator RpfG family c-di-GMP phosphodiesterase